MPKAGPTPRRNRIGERDRRARQQLRSRPDQRAEHDDAPDDDDNDSDSRMLDILQQVIGQANSLKEAHLRIIAQQDEALRQRDETIRQQEEAIADLKASLEVQRARKQSRGFTSGCEADGQSVATTTAAHDRSHRNTPSECESVATPGPQESSQLVGWALWNPQLTESDANLTRTNSIISDSQIE